MLFRHWYIVKCNKKSKYCFIFLNITSIPNSRENCQVCRTMKIVAACFDSPQPTHAHSSAKGRGRLAFSRLLFGCCLVMLSSSPNIATRSSSNSSITTLPDTSTSTHARTQASIVNTGPFGFACYRTRRERERRKNLCPVFLPLSTPPENKTSNVKSTHELHF